MPGIDTFKNFRMQQRLLDVMLQCIKSFWLNLCAQQLQHGMFKGVALKLFQASIPENREAKAPPTQENGEVKASPTQGRGDFSRPFSE